MNIEINGEIREVPQETTISQLLEELGLLGRRVAVEVNRELVPRGLHPTTKLHADDKVEVVTLVGGG